MTDEDAEEEAFREVAAFRARFPLEAFAGVAEALRLAPEPQVLSTLRNWLLPEFYFFFINCPGEEPTREERIGQLEVMRHAATALLRSIRITGGLTRTLREVADGAGAEKREEFRATLKQLAGEADAKIQRLRSSRGRAGRPRKDAFRHLSADLIRVYENLTRKVVQEADWESFYRFATAAGRCLRTCVREVDAELPNSSRAMREGLREVWNSEVIRKRKIPLTQDRINRHS
jgi:hypothetical protein